MRGFYSRSISKPRYQHFHDQNWSNHSARDHARFGRSRSRYNDERYCRSGRHGINAYAPRSAARHKHHRTRSVSAPGRRQQVSYGLHTSRYRDRRMEELDRLVFGGGKRMHVNDAVCSGGKKQVVNDEGGWQHVDDDGGNLLGGEQKQHVCEKEDGG
ncbi:hypothetical protein A2U01_0045873, partial [Trifolium medium]|nr:hypothetical protein [Trifolium medium]